MPSSAGPAATASTAAAAASQGASALAVSAASDGQGGRALAVGQNRATNAYIIQLAEDPVTAYTGTIKGYRATKPQKGQKIDPNSPAVTSYMTYLTARHDALLASVGATKKLYSYGYVFNGFAADLTPE